MVTAAIFRRQKPFSHGFALAERVIRGKRRLAQSACLKPMGVTDFTELAKRAGQFAARLQHLSPHDGASQHQPVTSPVYGRAMPDGNPIFMTNSPLQANRSARYLPFTAIFDHCAGRRLFPVQFVAEW
ncbi:MAG: hypothetical protein E5W86_20630 [Mesorhizobium sp.]|uniref:hypothetical protein n=1 Tax=Mesorhizobium sp. TaxID=1871066 RepID=UPI0011FF18A7|nr:hypothetical protein [Mesorhizobium sp.]TIT19320.1 MAG: hypothetical protein E5W86_20630 [Mesorhizobium sp.]TIW96854.1 MAG: hypothetical protein E5V45_18265 [Mesorhizobium sp.]